MKLHKSIADYAAIAVAPILIFIMISALANFLVMILYHGTYPQRVAWTLLMFTMGSVAIARIAIEQNRSYSLGYAAALGLATFVVMSQFVGSPLFCGFILLVIAYLADLIVRDCTIIDDALDASGEGLIDAGRLFVKQQLESDSDRPTGEEGEHKNKPHRDKPHQPGRTVMYLAFGALPLFGFGQFMLRSDSGSWNRAQFFLAFYLFAALALLVTTSFLGLRRYLRQRDAEMPSDVTLSWLGGGIAMIAAVLLIAYLVPLPGQALASVGLPDFVRSETELSASSAGWGDEGADRSNPEATTTTADPQSDAKEIHSQTMQKGAEAGDVGDGDRSDGPTGKQQGGEQQSSGSEGQSEGESKDSQQPAAGQSESNPSQSSSSEPSSESSAEQSDQADGEPSEPSSSSKSQDSSTEQDASESESESDAPAGEPAQQNEGQQNEGQQNEEQQRAPEDSTQGSEPSGADSTSSGSVGQTLADLASGIGSLFRLLIVAVLAAIVFVFLWVHRDQLIDWLRGLLNADEPEPPSPIPSQIAEPTEPPKPFSAYRNPIGTESDLRRVVVITFQAFEAWSREQGAVRQRDETPSEFARRVANSLPNVGTPVGQVVDAYNRIVYGRGKVLQRDVDAAQQVWQLMR